MAQRAKAAPVPWEADYAPTQLVPLVDEQLRELSALPVQTRRWARIHQGAQAGDASAMTYEQFGMPRAVWRRGRDVMRGLKICDAV